MSIEGPRLPPLTLAIKHLMIANAVIFFLNLILAGVLSAPGRGGSGGFWFAFSWDLGTEGYGLGLLRLVTYQFTHSYTNAWHFLMNMMVLYFMGTLAEPRLGYRGTIKLYLAGGVCGALLHLLVAASQGYEDIPLVGASGACYSFLVYGACRHPNALAFNILPLWILAALLVFVAFYDTFMELNGTFQGGVANGAHLGGAILGYVAFQKNLFVDWADHAGFGRRSWLSGVVARVKSWRASRAQEQTVAHQQKVDTILAKVKSEGLAALTPAERKFLSNASKQARK